MVVLRVFNVVFSGIICCFLCVYCCVFWGVYSYGYPRRTYVVEGSGVGCVL